MLALALPFEAISPIVGSFSDEKVVLVLLAAAWLASGPRAVPSAQESRALLPSLVLLLVGLLSALAAPDFGDEALRFVWRLLAMAFVLLVALRLSADPSRTRGLLWAIAVGGGASALLGLGEAIGICALQPVLGMFKVAPTRVGGELRVGASFQYATIASMYFEMVAPLAIVLSATTRQRRLQALGILIAVVCTANVVLSLTRAGVITLGLIYLLVARMAIARPTWRGLLPALGASATVLVGGVLLLLMRNPVFELRLVTEGDADWYGAAYTAPAALTLQPDEVASVALAVRNEGRITWVTAGQHPFALGYRWLSDDGSQVLDLPAAEVPLPRDVSPGETVTLQAEVRVPALPAGRYRLDWGMLQRDVLQFYERGWADAETLVDLLPAPSAAPSRIAPEMVERDDGEAPWVVGRLYLWAAATRIFQAHPLLGVGPDNFRNFYGAELGLESWDQRVQANNLYLELLADLGALGLTAFAWAVIPPLIAAFRTLRTPAADPARLLTLGATLAVVAFLVHGLLDSFLAFTPTALLFWALLGTIAQKPQVSGR